MRAMCDIFSAKLLKVTGGNKFVSLFYTCTAVNGTVHYVEKLAVPYGQKFSK
jgi:hypothetical protein